MEEMEIETDPTLITFGCIIAIADFQDQNAYVFGDGFLKNSLVLKNFIHRKTKIKKLVGLQNNSFFNCLFQVYPKILDTKKMEKLKYFDQQDGKEQDDQVNDPLDFDTEQETTFYDPQSRYKLSEKECESSLYELMSEYKYNIDTFEKSKQSKLSYNQPFLLLHLASSRFLACHEVESKYENQNYQLVLDDFTSDSTIFMIIPAFEFQKDGEQDVNGNEMCNIIRAIPISNKITYINCSNSEIDDIKNKQLMQKQQGSKNMQVIYKREMNVSIEQSHQWKIIKYSTYIPESSKYLVVGDSVWLHHSESESAFGAIRKKNALDKTQFNVKNHISQWLNLNNFRVRVLQNNQNSSDAYIASINGLWQIEGSDFNQGGYVQYERSYRLRHLTSGYYLSVKLNPNYERSGKRSKKKKYLFELREWQDDRASLFKFVELKTFISEKYVKLGSYLYIQNVEYNLWIDFYKIKKITTSQNMLIQSTYKIELKPQDQRTEHAVFKIHKASRNETWEINFLQSSFRVLAKFLIILQDKNYPGPDPKNRKLYSQKLQGFRECVKNLDDFVNNRAYCTSIQQQYGFINQERQKLLNEQSYMDLLVMVLCNVITKGEFELWQSRESILARNKNQDDIFFKNLDDDFVDDQVIENEAEELKRSEKEMANRQQDIMRSETLSYVGYKIKLCKMIYQFFESMCKMNEQNQLHLFQLIPFFQQQTKYLSSATNTIIDIIHGNRKILYSLSDGIKIESNLIQNEANQNSDMKNIKILINLYEDNSVMKKQAIEFGQHEKITQKPINLINYFINLIWDETAQKNSDYLKFLRNVCRWNNETITINQENIFKLYKRYNDQYPKLGVETKAEETKQSDGTIRLTSKAGQLIIPIDFNVHDKQSLQSNPKFIYIMEQLTFFSEVAQGRNFLWKKELGAQFEKSFLFRNIWNEHPTDPSYQYLQPCFAKIASSLYIDQEPLQQNIVPVYCWLFAKCDQGNDLQVFRSSVDSSQNYQELNTYNDLVYNMISYFDEIIYKSLISEVEGGAATIPIDQKNVKNQNQNQIGKDILKDELISDSTNLLYSLMKLNLFQVLDSSIKEKAIPSEKIYSRLLKTLLYIFQYEKFRIGFVRAHVFSYNEQIKTLIEDKKKKTQIIPININKITFNQSTKSDDEPEEFKGETQQVNEQSLYQNQLMRGYIKFSQRISAYNYMEPKYVYNERQIKLYICDILEYMMDMRQNFMLQNALFFFKHHLVNGIHQENNQYLLSQILKKQSSMGKENLKLSDITQKEIDDMIIKRVLGIHQLGLLPNVAQTGIDEIDNPKKESASPFSSLSKLKNINIFQQKQIKSFNNYIKEFDIKAIPEILDLDQLYSKAQNDPDIDNKPIGSLLPCLLHSYAMITDQELEKRCLGVIMRLFNQMREFKKNLKLMQVIFDKEKTQIYLYLKDKLKFVQKFVDRIDLWISNLGIPENSNSISDEFDQIYQIIKNLGDAMYVEVTIDNDGIIKYHQDIIDPEKQILFTNLDAQKPILNLIKQLMPYFNELILEEDFDRQIKKKLIKLIQACFRMLINFCWLNNSNQLKLYESLHIITSDMQYDLGQIELICNIFRENKFLLYNSVDLQFIKSVNVLIQQEGRQEIFLQIYQDIIVYENNYIFENQLIISNLFLPNIRSDRVFKNLYADGSEADLKFYLDDMVHLEQDDIIIKLENLDFKDTFRDEPFRFHAKLLDILLQLSLIQKDSRNFKVNLTLEDIESIIYSQQGTQNQIRVEDYKENFNIIVGRLRNYFRAEYLLYLLKQEDKFLQVDYMERGSIKKQTSHKGTTTEKFQSDQKKSGFCILKGIVMEFLIQVHILSERGSLQNSQLYDQVESVAQLYEIELKRLESIKEATQLTTKYVDYCFDGLIPFAICYYERFLKNQKEIQQGATESKDLQMIEKFTQKLLYQLIEFSEAFTPFVETQHRALLLFKMYYYFPCALFEQIKQCLRNSRDGQQDLIEELQSNKYNYNEKLVNHASQLDRLLRMGHSDNTTKTQQEQDIVIQGVNSGKYELSRSGMDEARKQARSDKDKKFKVLDEKETEEFNNGFEKEKSKWVIVFWKQYIDELVGNKLYEVQEAKEKLKIANALFSISKLLNPKFINQYMKDQKDKLPDINSISKKLILFLKFAFSDPKCKETVSTLLLILKRMVKQDDHAKMVEIQNLFNSLGATQMVLLVLSEDKNLDKQMMKNFLEFINTLLEGGNTNVQQTIYDYMINYQQSELIFNKIYLVIKKQIDNIQSKNLQNTSSQFSLADKDKPQSETIQIDELEFQEDLQLMNLALQFLQNSVEGHYLVLQNYLRSQTNSRNNYDLIQGVADLFKTYYYEARTQQNYENMMRCLDTLNELVQGPCLENQNAVSEGKFFDIAADLFQKKKKKKKKNKGEAHHPKKDLPSWMVTRLQNKVLMLLLSLLEGREINESNQVLKRIMRTLPLIILEHHLAKIYKQYKQIYGDQYIIECFDHLKQNPLDLTQTELSQKPHKKYFSTVLQNGFLLFFLTSNYLEFDPTIESPIVQLLKQYKKKLLEGDNENIATLLFKQSIFGQIVDFIKDLVDIFYDLINGFRKVAEGQFIEIQQNQQELSEEEQEKKEAKEHGKILKESLEFYMKYSAHIDVLHDDKLETIYFILLPFTSYLPKEKKLNFHEEVDRSTAQTKVSTLFNEADNLIEVCEHEEKLKLLFKKHKSISLFTNYVQLWQEFSFLLVLVLNIIIIFSFNSQWGNRLYDYYLFNQNNYKKQATQDFIYALGITMTCFTLFVVSFFLIKNVPIILKRQWREPALLEKAKNQVIKQKYIYLIIKNIIFWSLNRFHKSFKVFYKILTEIEIMYYILFVIMAVLGTFIHPFFFIFHLSEILFRYPTLKNIIKSVWQPRQQLMLSLMLLIVLTYMFSLLAYAYFYDQINGQCNTLLYCFTFCLESVVMGSIGTYIDIFTGTPNITENYGIQRWLFDNGSNILLSIIMLNIVGGIIIDTFGSLREQQNEKVEDKVNKCFICGNEASLFERNQSQGQGGFQEHIKLNHYMWNYLFFIAYLKYKDKTEYSGTESFVASKLEEDDLCWVPFNQARELRQNDGSEQVGETQLIEKLQDRVNKVQEQLKEVSKIIKINYKNK